jgi:hypothetical protein
MCAGQRNAATGECANSQTTPNVDPHRPPPFSNRIPNAHMPSGPNNQIVRSGGLYHGGLCPDSVTQDCNLLAMSRLIINHAHNRACMHYLILSALRIDKTTHDGDSP